MCITGDQGCEEAVWDELETLLQDESIQMEEVLASAAVYSLLQSQPLHLAQLLACCPSKSRAAIRQELDSRHLMPRLKQYLSATHADLITHAVCSGDDMKQLLQQLDTFSSEQCQS